MEKGRLNRKLAVILHADVVGSTLLVQQNETLTHERIQSAFNHFSETIKVYGGITRELRGDALLAEFEKASDAVPAALAFQAINGELNSRFDDDIRPQLRIGISLGEVIVADNTITGAGVVLAQRLEQLAKPDGVVVQGSVSETMPTRMPFDFESLGKQMLKGFEQPVRAFTVSLKAGKILPLPEAGDEFQANEHVDNQVPVKLSQESYVALIGEPIGLPDKPSIAVLPFKNMSGDAEQEHFADGMTEDLITSLSRLPELIVIASTSTFAYKGQAVDIRHVGQDLGVRHVLEGSIRKNGDHIRITAQLIDAQSGDHVWADRYDRKLEGIFDVQDEISYKICVELNTRLIKGEWITIGTKNVKAWELLMQALPLLDSLVRDDALAARPLLEQAIAIDENYSDAWTMFGYMHWEESVWNWCIDPEKSMQVALESAQKAIAADPKCPGGYELLSHINLSRGELDQAIAMGQKAYDLAPGSSDVMAAFADLLIESGRVNEGLRLIKKAFRYSPFPPAWYLMLLGIGFHLSGSNDKASHALKLAIEREPRSHFPRLWLASALVELQKPDEASSLVGEVIEIEPQFSTTIWTERFHSISHARLKNNLLAAGFPE
jgi:adenylate cyclase